MPSISRSALVPYDAREMFDLVSDIDRYEEFIPWCVRSRVLARDDDTVRAELTFSKGGVHKAFTTNNRQQRGKMIEIRLVEGPFRRLEGYWRFQNVGESASRVTLDMEFEFSNRIVAFAFGKVFTQVANLLVEAFVERARVVYGPREV